MSRESRGLSRLRIRRMVVKELRQLFRDPKTKRVIFVAPIIQLLLFGYAVNTDVRNVATALVDHDRSAESRALVESFTASGYFRVVLSSDRAADLGRALDHGYLVLFPATASFTGESSAELWSHGSPAVLAELVESAIAAGALPAGPGEFTYRALRNGRIDLSRAEAVRDLVDARTLYQARLAFSQADGAVARRVAPLRERLEEWIARP